MAFNKPYLGTKSADYNDKIDIPIPSGVYKGVVKNIDTNTRTGRLQVYISKFGGADPDDPKNWRLVSYASPFMGTTRGATSGYTKADRSENIFSKTQQSYGFFMTPPDIGSEVLCCWLEGINEGYWFASINSSISQTMLPAIGGIDKTKIDPISMKGLESVLRGNVYPVAEANENIPEFYGKSSVTDIPKPLHVPQTIILIRQGLDNDPLRGPITSSSQRDPVSSVFGFSSPGRPDGSQDPAQNPNLQNKLSSGNFNSADYKVTTRVGGHSFVMDDGDIYNKNNLVRLRTAAGHQIMLNDSEGFIYIANKNGTAWVELTAKGEILIYGQNDMSIRTKGDIMMHSDRNISLYAEQSIQMVAGKSIKIESQQVQANGIMGLSLYGGKAKLTGLSTVAVSSGGSASVKSSGPVNVDGSVVLLNSGSSTATVPTKPSQIKRYKLPDTNYNGKLWVEEPNKISSINVKVPTHEPYARPNSTSQTSTNTTVAGIPIGPIKLPTSGIASSTLNEQLTKAAPASAFILQPDPASELGALSKDNLRAYMAQMGYSESTNNYNAVNKFGYQGKYQLGSAALQDLGFIKPGTPQTAVAMSNPNNWTGKDGVTSSLDFLNNPSVQEAAMYDHTKRNYSVLQNKGLIAAGSSTQEIAGLLSSSHLVGASGTAKWASTGQPVSDANGVTAASYYLKGTYSQTQVPVIVASNSGQ